MRVDHDLEAASGVSVTAAPSVDNQSTSGIVRAERLSKQVVSPEGPLLILDDINFSIDRHAFEIGNHIFREPHGDGGLELRCVGVPTRLHF